VPGEVVKVIKESLVGRKVAGLRELYPHYSFQDLSSHPLIIFIPYQTSLILLFELVALNIPLLVPPPSLLLSLHKKFNLLNERTWTGAFKFDLPFPPFILYLSILVPA